MTQNSKRNKIQTSLVKPEEPTKNSSTGYAVSLGILLSLTSVFLIPAAFADDGTVIFIENGENCQNESCLSDEGLVIKQGSTVSWKNNDLTFHTIFSGFQDSGRDGKFESGMIIPGEKFSVTFKNDGYYYYYCDTHSWMKGAILVTS
jgi:plastocyanin